MDLLNTVLGLIVKFLQIGGSLWLIYGVIVLASGLKDKTGPQIQQGIWQIAGGGLILGSITLISSIAG